MLKLASRNLFRHATRTSLTLGAIVLGVVGLILSGGFIEDVFFQLREVTIHSQLGHVQVHRSGYSREGRRRPFEYLITNAGQVTDKIRDWPEVSDVLMRVRFSALANNLRADFPVLTEGIEPNKEAILGEFMTVVQGRLLEDTDEFGILMGEGVANVLNLKPGDPAVLLAATVDGALNSLDLVLVGTFRSFSKDYDDRAVRIPLATAQKLLGTGGVHSLVVSLKDTEYTDEVTARLKADLNTESFEVQPWYELADFYQKTVKLYQRQFGVLQFIILVMVFLSVGNSVNMSIYERTGEFGTQMAIGAQSKHIFRLIVTENALLGALGAAIGVTLGAGLAWSISKVGIPMPPPPNANTGYTAVIRIAPSALIIGFGIGFLATVLAAIPPARRGSRMPIVEALRQNV